MHTIGAEVDRSLYYHRTLITSIVSRSINSDIFHLPASRMATIYADQILLEVFLKTTSNFYEIIDQDLEVTVINLRILAGKYD